MPLSFKEIKERLNNIEIDPHFEIRSRLRNISIDKIKFYLENSMPIIKETGENRYKLTYQMEKDENLVLYIIKLPKSLKMLTCYIERRKK